MFDLTEADAAAQEEHFGVARGQIEHDFVISHVLNALAPHADRFVFYGGTALSRTILNGLRLSEDVDLLSIGPRADTNRNAPRDLYDLWAMAKAGHITPDAAQVYRQFGPTGGYPRAWAFPRTAPSYEEWYGALGHQCIPAVNPDEAYETVVSAWEVATAEAERRSLR